MKQTEFRVLKALREFQVPTVRSVLQVQQDLKELWDLQTEKALGYPRVQEAVLLRDRKRQAPEDQYYLFQYSVPQDRFPQEGKSIKL